MHRPRPRLRGWPILLMAFTMCPSIPREELACEEAKAWLQACCPGFTGRALSCETSGWTTADGTSCDPPGLGEADARCVTGRDCAGLVESGTCERARLAWDAGTVNTGFAKAVCAP